MRKQTAMRKFTTREIAIMALLTALCVVGRLMSSFLPNVQPVTAIILLLAIYAKPSAAGIVSILSMVITNFYLGMGIWTIAQIATYGILIFGISLLGKVVQIQRIFWLQVILCVVMSMGYGFLITLMLAPVWGVKAFWPYYFTGISFDIIHSIGTVGFFLLLRYPLLQIFKKYHFIKLDPNRKDL